MLDQRLHRRVVAVELAQLDRKAFAQIARADAGRIEFLQHRKHRIDVGLRGAEPLGGLAEIGRQIAGLIDEIDQILADHALRGLGEGDRKLFGEMIRQRHLGRDEGLEIVVLVVGGAAAPFGVGGRRGVLRVARGRFGRLLGEDVVEAGIEGLLDLGAAAEIAVHPVFLGRLKALGGTAASAGRAPNSLAIVPPPASSPSENSARSGVGLAGNRRLGAVAGPLQQRIALELLLDEGRQIEIGQLQQLDRLHQLRRHHQRLGLAEL